MTGGFERSIVSHECEVIMENHCIHAARGMLLSDDCERTRIERHRFVTPSQRQIDNAWGPKKEQHKQC